ncbi:MAG TPA: hypothetical protein VJ725_18145 [Thermoanaerobaculia bacterium]|nr:hypothetical protein [Thermoanaerobaculia bacterium]
MATDLFTPVLNEHTRSVRFFNGRLLSGEAMTDEQKGLRVARELLAQAVGDGIARGFEVKVAVGTSTVQAPALTVGAGVAINRRGEILLLENDTEVRLIRPVNPAQAPDKIFQTCVPPQQGVYIADAGVYLLTVCSIGAANGLAPVTGLGGLQASCNAKYIVDAVQFRLLELPVDKTLLPNPRLRNLVAYQCFGVDGLDDFATDPLGPTPPPSTLLDKIRGTRLTDCDVPLAVMYWTATGGVQFVDLWSVRRRVTETRAASPFVLDDARLATAEAMVLQFQEQIRAIFATAARPELVIGTELFRYLPPVGILPYRSDPTRRGFGVSFFQGLTIRDLYYFEGTKVGYLIDACLRHGPIDLGTREMITVYQIRENMQSLAQGVAVQPAIVFCNGHAPFVSDARYDLAHFNYANFA